MTLQFSALLLLSVNDRLAKDAVHQSCQSKLVGYQLLRLRASNSSSCEVIVAPIVSGEV